MFEIEIELDQNLTTSLLNRLVNSFPELEIETMESGLHFFLDPGDDVDRVLKNLDQVLDKFEKVRMGEEQVSLTLQNVDASDRELSRISVGRFIINRNDEKIEELPGKTIISLPPPSCFGTGAHPSTALLLTGIEEFFTPRPGYPDPMNSSVLDAGTGSGILALAAANLGTGSILAVDSSSSAIDTAQFNVSLNDFSERITLLHKSLHQVEGQFDLILANLPPSILIKSAPALVNLMASNGLIIAAGFMDTQTPIVLKSMNKAGIVMVKSFSRSGWTALSLKQAH